MFSLRSVRFRFLLPVLFTVALIAVLPPVIRGADKAAELDRYLNAARDVMKFQGAVLVARGGVPFLAKGYGMADIELGVPNTVDNKFLLGSITKQFTATAIMQLQEKGKLNVNDPISKYLPDYPKPVADKVTIRHLLTHTSGIPSYTDNNAFMASRTIDVSLDQLMAVFENLPLDFEPGSKFYYSNSGYVVLGAIVEKVSGESYEDYLQNHIFYPLDMKNSGYCHNDRIITGRATGYSMDNSGNIINAPHIAMSIPYAAGALYSTVNDLLKWDQALYTEKMLSKKSLQEMWTPVLENYGYGWHIADVYGHHNIEHSGGIDGFSTDISRFPDEKLTIIVLGNNEAVSAAKISNQLAAILFDQPYDVPVIKEPIALDPSALDEFVGVYKIKDGDYRKVTFEDGNLYSQRTGGGRSLILPEAADKFFFNYDNSITMTFVRDEAGKVIAHIVHQMGQDGRAERLEGPEADSLLAGDKAAAIDPELLAQYVGEYELQPGFVLTFRARDGRLFTQATGQSEFEVYRSSSDQFFLKVVDAKISFVRDDTGVVSSLILHQGGRDMPAKRIK